MSSHTENATGPVRDALAAIRAGDVAALARLLDASPDLMHAEAGVGGSPPGLAASTG